MLEAYVRPLYQKIFVNPIMLFLDKFTDCDPNQITYFSMFCGIFSAVSIMLHWPMLGLALLLLSGYCDSLDGSYARRKGVTSPHGAVLDIVGDRVVEFCIMFALFKLAPASRAIPAFFMLGSSLLCVTSFLVVGIFSENQTSKSFYYSRGIIERPEAFIFFALMIVLPHWFIPLAWAYTALVLLTAFIRVNQFMRVHP
ncbi:MAG: CDP-alcohol phosphatidyltransferase family protein [Gammaproteobacteria bacterium]|nr:CDP-alcohol phosphatidyltransferase family protein [Gammaproteobacteria bacterium]